ncbi:MAG: aldo/keto reductase, partial [Steroidobacteraceae bacterium]
RMKTDWIDLYQVHTYDALTPLDETLRALDDLVRHGKVRYIGCSNHSGWHLMKALHAASSQGRERYVSQQLAYSLLVRDIEFELVPVAADQRVGTVVYSPLAGGVLSGKYRRDTERPKGSRFADGGLEATNWDRLDRILRVLDDLSAAKNATVSQVALAWVLSRPTVANVLLGARDEQQLVDNLKAVDLRLSSEELTLLNEASAPTVPYPYVHQRNWAKERIPHLT